MLLKRRHIVINLHPSLEELDAVRARAIVANASGDHVAAGGWFRDGFARAVELTGRFENEELFVRTSILRRAVALAFDCGEIAQAKRWLEEALLLDPSLSRSNDWSQLTEVTSWPDDWLIVAVRCEPPDESALDALVGRYWGVLYGRCRLLTADAHQAEDLAQETWCRLLRNRSALKSGRNFSAYLLTIATNLWRDQLRSKRRAGELGEHRLMSLDAPASDESESAASFLEALPDLQEMELQAQRRLMIDVDQALDHLSPLLREALVARFLDGESCADIGRRHGRTEQTASGWIREAIRLLRVSLTQSARNPFQEAKL